MLKALATSTLATEFGRVVRRLRTEKGFSQESFADHCGLHRTYMGSIERGEKLISIETAKKVAMGLDMSLSVLMGHVGA